MILAQDRRFIFIHVPKAAGTSIHSALSLHDVFHGVRGAAARKKHAEEVARIMNEVVLQHGVKTIADTSKASKSKSIIEPMKERGFNLNAEDKWLLPNTNAIERRANQ